MNKSIKGVKIYIIEPKSWDEFMYTERKNIIVQTMAVMELNP
jgi:hypothetical protein